MPPRRPLTPPRRRFLPPQRCLDIYDRSILKGKILREIPIAAFRSVKLVVAHFSQERDPVFLMFGSFLARNASLGIRKPFATFGGIRSCRNIISRRHRRLSELRPPDMTWPWS